MQRATQRKQIGPVDVNGRIQRTACIVWYSFVPSVKIPRLVSLLLVLTPFALYQVSEVLPKFRDINSAYLKVIDCAIVSC